MTMRNEVRHWTCLALALAIVAATASAADARRKVECTLQREGATFIDEISVRVGSGAKRLTLVLTNSGVNGGDANVTMSASLGKRKLIERTIGFSGSTTRIVTTLGTGFKGIRQVELTTTDGGPLTGLVDGRAVTVSTTNGTADALTFTDGAPPPKLKVKQAVRRLLGKVQKAVQGASCPPDAPVPLLFNDCDACRLGCSFDPTEAGGLVCMGSTLLSGVACASSAAITPLLCIASFELNGLACAKNVVNCENACRNSEDCCPVRCPGAVGQCCLDDGEVCCRRDAPGGGTCCTNCCGNPAESPNALCCGRSQSSGEERNCVDPGIGLCCEPSGTVCGGTECCPPGWTCCDNSYCAPPGAACCSTPTSPQQSLYCAPGHQCIDPQANLCCATATVACDGVCCGAGQICAPGNKSCCNPLEMCGDSCCPSGVCVNGNVCCDDANRVCGGNCCGVGENCCNGQCCTGICIQQSGVCCPTLTRTCGTTCCPQGTACGDPATGRCDPCPGGVGEGCPFGVGSPLCCPTEKQCCTNNQCCAEGMECCGDPPICKPSFLCVQ